MRVGLTFLVALDRLPQQLLEVGHFFGDNETGQENERKNQGRDGSKTD